MKLRLTFLLVTLTYLSNAQENFPMLEWRTALAVGVTSENHFLATGGFNGTLTTNSAELFDGAEWIPVSNMMEARQNHTASSFGNGSVLIVGGYNGLNNLNSSEIYEPAFGTFGNGPDMTQSRSNHRATILDDGKIMITGGYNGFEELQSVEIYDPGINDFVDADNMITPRSSHTATILMDGRVLVTGGFNPYFGFQLNSCEIYDPTEDAWESIDPMSEARDNHAAVVLPDGKVLVSGGREYNSDEDVFVGMNSTEIFDPLTGDWIAGPSLFSPQNYHEMFIIGPELVLIPGGADVTGFGINTTYSPTESRDWQNDLNYVDLWSAQGRYRYAAVENDNGNLGDVMVCGGDNGINGTSDLYEHFVLSIEENFQHEIGMWPNPASESTFIFSMDKIRIERIEFIDHLGRVVHFQSQLSETSIVQDVSFLSNGIYVLRITFDDSSSTSKRLIVKH